ncbi:F-type H+-transporting ATPase subunit gamma [Mycoplasma testudineum]|uniref:ATP synthase gamma chain n=1 Tax=Mycoplasma testudineum TaxID=244584 RepID=A0A4R6IGC5_9MOLU|nr:ATP synthase F1 subunit gamma [Mycoplasma testudineum]OYD27132.1 F0F1 ATP synthase subunit gamma [Mycoplasma testudineum]TDO21114.1 F-type H+-transporting ATPase subunit gamma [Mycoplasma testudineum]
MASLQKINQRISLVDNIKKITKAMELVATSKLRKLQNHSDKVNEYSSTVDEMFQKVSSQLSKEDLNLIYPQNPKDAILYVVITSDLGLAGSYNSDIYKLVKSLLKPDDKVIILGSKGINHFSYLNEKILAHYANWPDFVRYENIEPTIEIIFEHYYKGEFKQVNVIYTKFVNVVTTEKVNLQLLPILVNDFKNTAERVQMKADIEFEPNPETIFKSAMPLYIGSRLYGLIAESKVSEMANRRVAMENSTRNAGELIGNLKIEFNRRRQAAITQEIAEIVGGSVES